MWNLRAVSVGIAWERKTVVDFGIKMGVGKGIKLE